MTARATQVVHGDLAMALDRAYPLPARDVDTADTNAMAHSRHADNK
jgi:hypothetical protein